jgi:hypothetical protein
VRWKRLHFERRREMIKTIHYSSVERIDYKFSEGEIEKALMVSEGINYVPSGDKIEFEIFEDSDGTHSAILSVIKESKK